MRIGMIPHPVLLSRSVDYTDGFKFDMQVEDPQYTLDEKISISTQFVLESRFINEMIKKGRAKIFLVIKCPKTYARDTIPINGMEEKLELLLSKYVDKIKISSYIAALEEIKHFKSDEHHRDFAGVDLTVPAGGILARADDIELEIDSLQTIQSAIILVTNPKLEDAKYEIDLDDECIKISANDATRRKIERVRSSGRKLFPSLYMVVMMHAMQNIAEHSERKWADALYKTLEAMHAKQKKKFNKEDVRDNAYEHAQMLLGNPMKYIIEEIEND